MTVGAVPLSARPRPSVPQQWWTLTTRMIAPTVANGELATQIIGSIVFTVGFYLPLKNILGAVQPMSSYAQYLTPLIVVQAIFFAAVSAAFRSAIDALAGINRRFRAMPMPRLTPLSARMTASMYRCVVALVVALVCGHIIGFRFYGSVWHTVGFVALALLIGAALALMGDLIGAATRNPEATAPLLLVPQVTLGLASVGLQPVERFPGWIQPFVRDQPLSQWLNALRALAGDSTPAAPAVTWSVIGPALAWVGAIFVIFLWLHARVARRP
ncbi:MAG: antibiotic transporter [Mycobacterium sp.]|nr:antibiotic transporter [Mycobacterium sp.]